MDNSGPFDRLSTRAMLLVLAFIGTGVGARSQDSAAASRVGPQLWSIGVHAGAQRTGHDVGFATLGPAPTCCGGYPDGGFGYGFNASVVGKWWPWERSWRFSVQGALEFSFVTGAMSQREPIGYALDVNSEVVVAESEYSLSTGMLVGSIVPAIRFQPLRFLPLSLAAAVGVGTPLSSSYSEAERLVAPGGVAFLDGEAADPGRRNAQSGDITAAAGVLFDVRVGVAYDVALPAKISGLSVVLTPEIWVTRNITSAHRADTWNTQSIRFGLSASLLKRGPYIDSVPQGVYRIVYDSKPNEEAANDVQRRLEEAGAGDVEVVRLEAADRIVFQVQSGTFDTFDEAVEALEGERNAWTDVIGRRPNLQEVAR